MSAIQIAVLLLLSLEMSSSLTSMTESDHEFVIQNFCITTCPPDTDCILIGEELITNFTTPDLSTCKLFCWYTESCYSFSFESRSSLCGLYSNYPNFKFDYELPSHFKSDAHTFSSRGDMDCIITYESNPSVPCRSFDEILTASTTSDGILIKHVFGKLCLDFGKALTLTWKNCTSAILWKLKQYPFQMESFLKTL